MELDRSSAASFIIFQFDVVYPSYFKTYRSAIFCWGVIRPVIDDSFAVYPQPDSIIRVCVKRVLSGTFGLHKTSPARREGV